MAVPRRHASAILAERRYTVMEAACLADVHPDTIKAALRRGELHGVKRRTTWKERRPGPQQGAWRGRVYWEVTGADLIAWYEVVRQRWLNQPGRGGRGAWAVPRPDRISRAALERHWRRRRRARELAVLTLAREIIRQAGDLIKVELEGGASISGGDGSGVGAVAEGEGAESSGGAPRGSD